MSSGINPPFIALKGKSKTATNRCYCGLPTCRVPANQHCHTRVEEKLHNRGFKTYVLDGDNVRHGVCGDIGFSEDDRKENIRRIGEMGKLFIDAGLITFSAFISPFKSDQRKVRHLLGKRYFVEIYCNASL